MPLSTTISGLNNMVEIRIGVMTVFAVSSGSEIAMLFGTSSPNTIDSTVAIDSPKSRPTVSAVTVGQPDGLERAGDQVGHRRLHDEAQRQGGDGDADLRAGQLGGQRPQPDHQRLGAAVALGGLFGHGGPVDGHQAELGRDVQGGAGDQQQADTDQDPLRDQCSMLHEGISRVE